MHPEWQSLVYWEGKLMPIGQMKWNYNGMMNPANPEVQKISVINSLKECATKYKNLDGIILDRMRFDNMPFLILVLFLKNFSKSTLV